MIERLALGTVQFGLEYGISNQGERVSSQEAGKILAEAHARGMRILDTAIAYGDSEQVLGKLGVSNWHIVSKLPAIPPNVSDVAGWVVEQTQGSLARMGVRSLYGVLLHRPDQLLGPEGKDLLRGLQQLKQLRLTEKVGVSIYAPEELDLLQSVIDLELVQAPLNILDRRMVDSGWAQRLKVRGGELHVRSVFLQGLLLMAAADRHKKFKRWTGLWKQWHGWLEQTGISAQQACIRFALSVIEADKIVIGVDSVNQLQQIMAAADGSLPPLPGGIQTDDLDLINPGRWNQL